MKISGMLHSLLARMIEEKLLICWGGDLEKNWWVKNLLVTISSNILKKKFEI